jgi:hypothetical protein
MGLAGSQSRGIEGCQGWVSISARVVKQPTFASKASDSAARGMRVATCSTTNPNGRAGSGSAGIVGGTSETAYRGFSSASLQSTESGAASSSGTGTGPS